MADAPHRTDTWLQWAGIILAIVGAVWNMAGRMSRIEQQLRDNADGLTQETQRVDALQKEFSDWLEYQAKRHVAN